jgi:hypothetical protein
MTEDQVRDGIRSAIDAVLNEARPLDFHRVHERSIAHRLALHMEPHFHREWDVDCEYDLDGLVKKTLLGIAECDGRETDRILPDIIVHHRYQHGREHNLLVVEIKKNTREDPCDRRKLELLTDSRGRYQYQLGLYIYVDGGGFGCTWYRDGQKLE